MTKNLIEKKEKTEHKKRKQDKDRKSKEKKIKKHRSESEKKSKKVSKRVSTTLESEEKTPTLDIEALSDPIKEAIKFVLAWKAFKKKEGDWKFKKNIQNWILRNILSEELIPINFYEIVLEYISSIPSPNSLLLSITSEITKKKTMSLDISMRESHLLDMVSRC